MGRLNFFQMDIFQIFDTFFLSGRSGAFIVKLYFLNRTYDDFDYYHFVAETVTEGHFLKWQSVFTDNSSSKH